MEQGKYKKEEKRKNNQSKLKTFLFFRFLYFKKEEVKFYLPHGIAGRKRLQKLSSDIVFASTNEQKKILFLLFVCIYVVCKAVVFLKKKTLFLYLCLCYSLYFAVIFVSAIAFWKERVR